MPSESSLPFCGVWCRPELLELLESGELDPREVCLLLVIDSLSNRAHICTASNKYLGKMAGGIGERQVRLLISKLTRTGLIVQRGFDGRVRRITSRLHS